MTSEVVVNISGRRRSDRQREILPRDYVTYPDDTPYADDDSRYEDALLIWLPVRTRGSLDRTDAAQLAGSGGQGISRNVGRNSKDGADNWPETTGYPPDEYNPLYDFPLADMGPKRQRTRDVSLDAVRRPLTKSDEYAIRIAARQEEESRYDSDVLYSRPSRDGRVSREDDNIHLSIPGSMRDNISYRTLSRDRRTLREDDEVIYSGPSRDRSTSIQLENISSRRPSRDRRTSQEDDEVIYIRPSRDSRISLEDDNVYYRRRIRGDNDGGPV